MSGLTAREKVLLRGLIDWVAFERVHHCVADENAGQPLAVVRDKTLDLIGSLVGDGLFELGDLSGDDGRFVAWNASLDDALQQILDRCVADSDDVSAWWFCCWLDLTDAGQRIAEAIESRVRPNPQASGPEAGRR